MRLIIFWSTSANGSEGIIASLLDSLPHKPEAILLGVNTGLSIAIEAWAEKNDVGLERYHPQYNLHSDKQKAILMRNQQMVGNATVLLVIWDGKDQSCKNMLSAAEDVGLKCLQFNPMSEKKDARLTKKISLKEVYALKLEMEKHIQEDRSKTVQLLPETVLLLIDAINRRDYVIKSLSEGQNKK